MPLLRFFILFGFCAQVFAATELEILRSETKHLQEQASLLSKQLQRVTAKLERQEQKSQKQNEAIAIKPKGNKKKLAYHSSPISVHSLDLHPDSIGFYPTALEVDSHVLTYIAGTPIVASPYLGSRPAFDGSDYIVNVSSINRDVRLMQQRRRLSRIYRNMGYPAPNIPIIAISGKVMPAGVIGRDYFANTTNDWNLGSSELDVAAAINQDVEAYMGIAYDSSPPASGGQRVTNSALRLSMGFVNIGNLDKSPFYFSAGQMLAPFGNFSSAMISAPIPLIIGRTLTRPFILGYKSQADTGPFLAVYGFRGDTTLGGSGVGGVNAGYVYDTGVIHGQFGASFISSINNANGMQFNGSVPGTTFAGFSSSTNGSENVKKVSAVDVHGNVRFRRFNFTAEWVGVTEAFRRQDLSFNVRGARPSAGYVEGGTTFTAFCRPTSVGIGYQWSVESLALKVPKSRINALYSMSIWKDTVESLEYRYDTDYRKNTIANGAANNMRVNANTIGTGEHAHTLLASIGVYF